jgi:hypothetical protein
MRLLVIIGDIKASDELWVRKHYELAAVAKRQTQHVKQIAT